MVTIGILAYNGKKYFDALFSSLLQQEYSNIEVRVLDNASPENNAEYIQKRWNDDIIVHRSEKNLGFGGGHNRIIREMKGQYYLCFNQDMFAEPNFVSELVTVMQSDNRIGSVTGKLYQWNAEKGTDGKTHIIDTVGLKAYTSHRFEDEGQGQEDTGQYDAQREIFGASGAAVMYRKEALDDIAFVGAQNFEPLRDSHLTEYFDQLMFLYKEDIDLAYRLRWAGWKCLYTPKAIAYHDRTVEKASTGIITNRKNKSLVVKKWSFLDHQILLQKNFSSQFSFKTKLKTWWYQLCTYFFTFFCEPKVFWYTRKKLKKLSGDIAKKKKSLKKKASPKDIEQFFDK